MPIEPVTHIADLDPANPDGAQAKSQGDDHIRNLKTALKNSLPGFDGAVIAAGTNGGVADAYTLTPNNELRAYSPRMLCVFTPTASNTGAATLDISGLGARPIRAVDGSVLAAGDLAVGRTMLAVYDGAQFRLVSITQRFIEQLVISGTVPGVNVTSNAGKFFTTDGTTGQWAAVNVTPTPGSATFNKGNSGTSAQIVNYAEGEGQTITGTGLFNLSVAGFPAGRIAGILIRVINGGVSGMTSTGIQWLKFDGTKTTDFTQSGITLNASGETLLAVFSYGDGTIYGKGV